MNEAEFACAVIEHCDGYTDLARKARVSTATISRIRKGQDVPIGSLRRVCAVLKLPDPYPMPDNCRIIQEWELRDQIAGRLTAEGFDAIVEHPLPSGRKVDIVARKNGVVKYIIEAKVKDALAGIGQLIADQLELEVDATMVLLVSPELDRRVVRRVCDKLRIELWVDQWTFVNRWPKVARLQQECRRLMRIEPPPLEEIDKLFAEIVLRLHTIDKELGRSKDH